MIKVSHLTKTYGSLTAVNDLNFTIGSGMVYGFLGPNGAGKSTTMNMMTGCLSATAGTVELDGLDAAEHPEEVKSKIGYLPEQPPVYPDLTPREYLRFVGRAKGLRGSRLLADIEHVAADTQIDEVMDRLIRNLSKGYRQRVGIAQAMLGDPQVIILDEPTVGLDPQQIHYIRSLIRRLGKKHTVILSSHILPEIEAVCDHIMILSHGRLVANDTLENLRTCMAGERTVTLTVGASPEELRRALAPIAGIDSFETASAPSSRAEAVIHCKRGCDISLPLSDALLTLGCPVFRLETNEVTLEDVFLSLTSDGDDKDIRGGLRIREELGEDDYSGGDENEKSEEQTKSPADTTNDEVHRLPDDYDRNRGNDDSDGYTPLFR